MTPPMLPAPQDAKMLPECACAGRGPSSSERLRLSPARFDVTACYNDRVGAARTFHRHGLIIAIQGTRPASRRRRQKPVAKRAITTMMATCIVPWKATMRT